MKKILYVLAFIVIGTLIWYFAIKPSDYTIRFKTNAVAGTVNQSLKLWDQVLDTVRKIRQEGDIYHLSQKIRHGDSVHTYHWKIKPLTDSTSQVIVNISDEDHSLSNRIQVPFQETDFVRRSKKTVRSFMENLNEHTQSFSVTVVGEEEMPMTYIAYIPLQLTQFQKAGGMMRNLSYLTSELAANEVQLNGPPIIEVTQWNMDNDSLYYNFGQPVVRSERLPMDTDIKYKRLFPKRALKAIYNGNYITSDRAWYALLNYAKKHDIEVEHLPVEVFYNNPNTGIGEEQWKAEIYMPIKETDE